MKHEESNLQKQCVSWFRAQYPQYAMLLTHPINEGSGHSHRDRIRQAIHKAEGAVAGVPDLLLFIPSVIYKYYAGCQIGGLYSYNGLGIEFKTKRGRQSQEQKDFQRMFETAAYRYIVVRSFEEFQNAINEWMRHVDTNIKYEIMNAYQEITKAAEQREKEKFYKIIGKK